MVSTMQNRSRSEFFLLCVFNVSENLEILQRIVYKGIYSIQKGVNTEHINIIFWHLREI